MADCYICQALEGQQHAVTWKVLESLEAQLRLHSSGLGQVESCTMRTQIRADYAPPEALEADTLCLRRHPWDCQNLGPHV